MLNQCILFSHNFKLLTMFVVVEFEDLVKIKPSSFQHFLQTSITESLNNKLANKVIPNVGLCIVLFDLLHIGDSFIFPGEGAHHTKVKFRFIVFRPFMNEVITGKIKGCSQEGVQVTLGFFDDIQIPANYLQYPSKFNEEEQVWIWEYEDNGNKHELFMDVGENIKFRIISESFVETSPEGSDSKIISGNKIPYMLTGSINEPGLGVMSWWVY